MKEGYKGNRCVPPTETVPAGVPVTGVRKVSPRRGPASGERTLAQAGSVGVPRDA